MILTKVKASRALADVEPQYVFWLCDGTAIKNIRELHSALSRIDEGAYNYHANESKNDFSAWVNDVVLDPKLASGLHKARTKAEALTVLKARIAWLNKKHEKHK